MNPGFGPIETYFANISTFAGEDDVVLKFDAAPGSETDLDAIQFSTIVPEPSSLALLAIGILSLGGYVWRRARVDRLEARRS